MYPQIPLDRRGERRPTHVYRMFAGDDLIYIGCTIRLWERMSEHRRFSWWSPTVTKVRAELAPNQFTGRLRETAAIQAEQPHWNLNDLSRLIPSWSEEEFAEFMVRWLIDDSNAARWAATRSVRPRFGNSAYKFDRLLRTFRLHNGREFDRNLLDDCGIQPPTGATPSIARCTAVAS